MRLPIMTCVSSSKDTATEGVLLVDATNALKPEGSLAKHTLPLPFSRHDTHQHLQRYCTTVHYGETLHSGVGTT